MRYLGWVVVMFMALGLAAVRSWSQGTAPATGPTTAMAEHAVIAKNLKSILGCLVIYSTQFRDQLPDDLGVLFEFKIPGVLPREANPTEDLRMFVPTAAIPEEIVKGTVELQADWVRKNSPFVYLGKGKRFTATLNGATTPLVIESPSSNKDKPRLSVGFYDAHVETRTRKDVEAMMPK